MQRLLKERQDSLISLEIEKTENIQRIDDLLKELRNKNEIEDRLKENIWNLELTKQDLSHQIRQLSLCISKNQMEQARRDRQENLLHQELELLKTSQLNWEEARLKLQYDYDFTVSELNQSIETLRKERDEISVQMEDLVHRESRKKHVPELDGLKSSLAQAESVVAHLQNDLDAERKKKQELDLLLRESQEMIENIQKGDSSGDKRLTIVTLEDELSHVGYETYNQSFVQVQSFYNKQYKDPYKASTENDEFKQLLPYIMHTMIGEWVYKYTRNKVGHGISEKHCHKRFFWLHPYTKTLYWSQQQPGVEEGEWKVKSGKDV
ncbi:meiotic cell cortex C-terminal pleckstrin homology-domain-containing protein [Pilobolus umbonatus]|nr:meiotic cell cortex C-terminal pleckstrin homology-domain-containing protein [Pilobolus umbonatus]